MKIENPHIKKLHQLKREDDESEEYKQKIKEVEDMSRAHVEAELKKMNVSVNKVHDGMREIKQEFPSARQQYKKACELYQEIMQLWEDNKFLKKELREEINGGK